MEADKQGKLDCSSLPLRVEFSGGLELLFNGQRKLEISIPAYQGQGKPSDINYLIEYLCDKIMTDTRRDMFVLNGTVRPGVLVLVNDADWELEGEGEYVLKPKDNIMFVSTLHGG